MVQKLDPIENAADRETDLSGVKTTLTRISHRILSVDHVSERKRQKIGGIVRWMVRRPIKQSVDGDFR
jgi:hypothetical protein